MKSKKKIWELLPIIIALGYIPLLVHMHTYDCKLSQFEWFPDGAGLQSDFFLYFKMVAIIAVGILMAGILVYKYATDKKNMKWNKALYCLLGYAFFVFLSALFSKYRYFAFRGSYEVFESVWVVLAYAIFCVYSYQMVTSEDDVKCICKFAGIGIGIVSIIGVLQYFGFDFFRTTIGKKLITNPSYWPQVDQLSFTFPLKTSYTTLYNTNYLAFYFGLLIPIFVILLLFAKNWKIRALYAAGTVVLVLTMVGSNSKSGFLALGATIVLGVIVLFRKLIKNWKVLIGGAIALVAFLGVYSMRWGGIGNLVNTIVAGTDYVQYSTAVSDIETNDDNVVFTVNGTKLFISYDMDAEAGTFLMDALYENGDSVPVEQDSETGTLYLKDETFLDCQIAPIMIGEEVGLQVFLDDHTWHFMKRDGSYYFYNAFGKWVKMESIEKSNLFPDNIFSGRGELWNYLVPRLKNCLILGNGANTFAMVYPQNNYIVKKYRQTESLFDVKPHNMYLQQFVEEGLLALLAWLVFYLWYFVKSFKIYRKIEQYDFMSAMGLGIYLGTFTYMFAGIANDSNVCTAPVFWIIFGIGWAVNEIVQKKQENNV